MNKCQAIQSGAERRRQRWQKAVHKHFFSCSLRRKQQVFNIDDDANLKAKGYVHDVCMISSSQKGLATKLSRIKVRLVGMDVSAWIFWKVEQRDFETESRRVPNDNMKDNKAFDVGKPRLLVVEARRWILQPLHWQQRLKLVFWPKMVAQEAPLASILCAQGRQSLSTSSLAMETRVARETLA